MRVDILDLRVGCETIPRLKGEYDESPSLHEHRIDLM